MSRTLLILILCLASALGAWMLFATVAPTTVELPPPEPEPESVAPPADPEEPPDPLAGSAEEAAPAAEGQGSIRGLVTKKETGEAVAGVEIQVQRGRWSAKVQTDPGGAYLVEAVPAGRCTVRARSPSLMDPPAVAVAVEVGEEAVVDIQLIEGGVVTGVVTDRDRGSPLEGARVNLAGAGHKASVTGPDGVYRLTGVSAGGSALEAAAEGYPLVRTAFSFLDLTQELRRDLALVRGATVAGTVTDSRDAPIAGAKVSVRTSALLTVEAGADGRFTLHPVPAERTIYITGEAEGHAPARSTPLVLRSGETYADLRLVLPAGARIKGVVLLANGEPAVEATVLCHSTVPGFRGGASPRATTDAEGRFTLFPVSPGEVRLMAMKSGALQTTQALTGLEEGATREGIELKLGAAEEISGVVRDGGGEPVPGAVISARPGDPRAGGRWGSSRADQEGAFVVVGLVAGSYTLTARLPRGGAEGAAREARTGEKGVVLTLPTPGSASGRVVRPGGEPVSAYTLRAEAEGRRGRGVVIERVRNEAGEFRLEGVSPGTYLFSASADGGHSEPLPGARIVAGQETTGLLLILGPGGTVTGVVADSGGRPLPKASVTASRQEGRVGSFGGRSSRTDAEGRFSLSALPPGRYRIRASADGLYAESAEVQVSSGSAVEVEVRMPGTGRLVVRVADAEGRPLAGAWVNLSDARGRGIPPRPTPVPVNTLPAERNAALRAARNRALRTDANGVCVREGVPEGTITVRIVANEHAPGVSRVEVSAGEAGDVRVALEKGSPGRSGHKLRELEVR